MSQFPYATAEAFAAALADRFSAAHATSRYSINELRRQFAYDRLLARIFHDTSTAESWILKGGFRLPSPALLKTGSVCGFESGQWSRSS